MTIKGSAIDYRYGRRQQALRDVDFCWPSGFVALLGPNGAGKSTLLSLLVGARKMQSGTLTLPHASSVGYVPQLADWPGRYTVRELLTYAAWWRSVPASHRGGLVDATIRRMGLDEVADQRLSALSGGFHRRTMVAQALVHQPSLLILDEPSAGLDPRQRVQLRTLLAKLAKNRTVVVATHVVDDVESVADWLSVIDNGRVVFDDSMDEVRRRWGNEHSGAGVLESAYLSLVP